jgi:hypothetical protein
MDTSSMEVDRTTKAAKAATDILLKRSEGLFLLAAMPEPVADPATLADLGTLAFELRETMRLFAPLYPSAEYERWWRRVRTVTRAVWPLLEVDAFIGAVRAASRGTGEPGKRATAFLIGHMAAMREYEMDIVAARVEAFGMPDVRAKFRRFARDPKAGSGSKVTLQAFAAGALADRIAAYVARVPAVLVDGDPEAMRVAGKALSKLAAAVDALSGCYADDEYAKVRTMMTALQKPLESFRQTQVFLGALRDPELAINAKAAGVTVGGLRELEAVFAKREAQLMADVSRAAARYPEAAISTALLSPLVPGFIAKAPEPAKPTGPARPAAQAKSASKRPRNGAGEPSAAG